MIECLTAFFGLDLSQKLKTDMFFENQYQWDPTSMYKNDMSLQGLQFIVYQAVCVFFSIAFSAFASNVEAPPVASAPVSQNEALQKKMTNPDAKMILKDLCTKQLKSFKGKNNDALLAQACSEAKQLDVCQSANGTPIFHYDKKASSENAKKILVFSLIHGDETDAGVVGRYWIERLHDINPRNNWRIVPVLNPDGVLLKTRTNANKIDLNRNFPTRDWQDKAVHFWHVQTKSNPRRYPGSEAASESETKCALQHIGDYQPHFVVSIHTPLNVLDYDGPKVKPPNYSYLPWRSLGHFPGSLGRYMWFEREIPVLTIEMKESLPDSYLPFEKLHDVIGQLVKYEIQAKDSKHNP